MTKQAAVETGRITLRPAVAGCTGFYLAMYGDGSGPGPHGYFTEGRGLSVIRGQGEMHTLETAPVGDDRSYFFVSKGESVSGFGLALNDDPCLTEALD